MELSAKYNPSAVEDKWYANWIEKKFFHSEPDGREPYTIVIPPPNVTGILHMGHVLNNTLNDVLVRKARMEGKNACWIPGTDHASIATENKVVEKLEGMGIRKETLTREEFLRYAWEWKEEHGGIILNQLRKLGASCDWDRTKFTMDPDLSQAVIRTFVHFYKKGYIYRGVRMVNWDPQRLTAVSDEEVIHRETRSRLYYLRYYLSDGSGRPTDEYLLIATTRPETIMADTAVSVNPADERYFRLKGRKVLIPLLNREIPVIEDDYVSMDFGTGCLKVTPAHDINDYEIGLRHRLPVIDILDDHGRLNENARLLVGEDRFTAREKITELLREAGNLEKTEDYTSPVGYSERSNAVIEPKLSTQWFLKMETLAAMALESVESGKVRLIPDKYRNTYRHWMENVHDWCISRQLWWGQRIPAWYLPDGRYVVEATAEEALAAARRLEPGLRPDDLKQDEDVLDTWFSSWLWPISVFDAGKPGCPEKPANRDLAYYYPTNDLVTGPDILFFWVARMIMAGDEFMGREPFRNVYLTGIVRDKEGRKMSKTLGNSPDPLELIGKYGADAVRIGMLLCASAGNDIFYDESQVEQGRNFCNKIWNAFRLIQGWTMEASLEVSDVNELAVKWFDNKLNETVETVEAHYAKFRISDALMCIYKLFREDFCSWYLELVKPRDAAKSMDCRTYKATLRFFETLLKLLHPVMPFITEELWHAAGSRSLDETLMLARSPQAKPYDREIVARFELAQEAVNAVRGVRQQKNISPKEELALFVKGDFPMEMLPAVQCLAHLSSVTRTERFSGAGHSFLVGACELFLPLGEGVNAGEEAEKLRSQLEYQRQFLRSVRAKLSNARFLAHAPEAVVAVERKKEADALARIGGLEARLRNLEAGGGE